MKSFSELTPGQKAQRLGAVTLGVIFAVLAIFLAITWVTGDPTNDKGAPRSRPASSSVHLPPG